ncbi:MAG: glycosyltransferase [Clostridia bacterium]|nr:glycosyltransferase [Clostridia bacterium]
MILQELRFPNYETCADYGMYFRLEGESTAAVDAPQDKVADELAHYERFFRRQADIRYDNAALRRAYYDPETRALHLASWQRAGFDTYFNCFSVGKWKKYTRLDNLKLRIELKGSFQVTVLHMYSMYTEPFEHAFCERVCRASDRTAFEFDIPLSGLEGGIVCFRLYALEGADNVFYGGGYVTDVDEASLNPVDIAIDTCTFRRERYIMRNVALMNRDIIDDPKNPVHGHLDIFISDNGQTLDVDAMQSDRVHIFPNRNVGGAGGFTRGMIEILDMMPARSFTHVLVMDDDVLINTDAIVRTYRLLQFLKPECIGKTVAGAMLRLDNRSMQHECGGWWDGFCVHNDKTKLDLKRIENILFNEKEDMANYNAWWYSCIPASKISNDNLPLPIFIRYDDVEFGLRTGSDMIAMSGICLWHEPFEYRFSASSQYYEIRNEMIVNALHMPGFGFKQAREVLRYSVKVNIGRYRYSDCKLAFKAMEDFCKGPEFLLNTDGEALHKEIMLIGDRFQPLKELPVRFDENEYIKSQRMEKPSKKRLRILTLNKHLLRRKGDAVVDAAMNGVKDFAGKKRVLNYDVGGNRGFVTEYNRKRLMETLRGYRRTVKLMKAKYSRACEAWRQAMPTLTSRAFWDGYLGLK